MKKRTILALILTIFTLFALNKLWLTYKPMTVDMDISGKGKCSIEVQLNKKSNNEFEKIKTQVKKVNLDKISHVKFSVQRSKFPKRIRFVFNNFAADNPIVIKSITLKNGKYKLDDLYAFSVNAGKLAVSNNALQITPPPLENSMILTYNNNLNIRTSVKFDIKIFIAVLILTYLLAYKLTDYVANFNTVQNISKIEIIFLSIFFIFLFIPMCHINQDKISVKENRTLAKWKPLVTNKGQINYNFGKDYNNWFNDRFNLRQFLLDSHIKLLMNVTNKLPKGRIDKDGFVYGDYELSTSPLKKINDADYNALIKFDKYCKDHNIEFYVLLVPIKKYIYPPTENMLYKDEYAVNIDKKVKELNQKYDMHIVNPIENLKAGTKDTYTYFKTDPHWTFDGAYIGYKELMKEINKKHNDIYVLQEKDFNFYYSPLVNSNFGDVFGYGYYSVHLNLPEKYIQKIHKENYRYFSHKNANALEIKKKQIPLHLNKKYYFPDGADYRVIVFGASMTENLDEFMPYTFKNLFHLRINNVKNVPASEEYKVMKHYEKEMMSYKPDIIVLCIGYIELYKLHDFFKK